MKTLDAENVGEALLLLLAERGVEYLFANAGTDFAPIIEAYARSAVTGSSVPKPVTVPHENVAVAAAMGHYLMSGRTQAVMVHVNVGVANALCGLFNARRGNVPILFMSGRTPITEHGLHGSRDVFIHWTQEMFDQGGIVREATKWDYELRNAVQVETVVDRAIRIANSDPKGPVYISLPREVLVEKIDGFEFSSPSRQQAAVPPSADDRAIAELASLIAAAESPLIVTSALGQNPGAVPVLEAVAERFAIPVVQYVPRAMSISTEHPMHLGYDPKPLLEAADVVLCVDTITPWLPVETGPRADAKVVHMDADPLHGDLPIHGYPCDLAITTAAETGLGALDEALGEPAAAAKDRIEARRARLAETRTKQRAQWDALREQARSSNAIHPAWLTHCIDEAKPDDAVIIREAPTLALPMLSMTRPRTFLGVGAAGGLGWGLGTAIGAKMAVPERLVIACEGDGAYMFGVPVAAHYVAMEQKAPFLTVIYNNRRWNEVRRATHGVFPDGYAAKSNSGEPLTYFDHSLALYKAVETAGGHGEQVTDPAALPEALERAIRMVQVEERQVVLDVICSE